MYNLSNCRLSFSHLLKFNVEMRSLLILNSGAVASELSQTKTTLNHGPRAEANDTGELCTGLKQPPVQYVLLSEKSIRRYPISAWRLNKICFQCRIFFESYWLCDCAPGDLGIKYLVVTYLQPAHLTRECDSLIERIHWLLYKAVQPPTHSSVSNLIVHVVEGHL